VLEQVIVHAFLGSWPIPTLIGTHWPLGQSPFFSHGAPIAPPPPDLQAPALQVRPVLQESFAQQVWLSAPQLLDPVSQVPAGVHVRPVLHALPVQHGCPDEPHTAPVH
jgi:hypothetical protein